MTAMLMQQRRPNRARGKPLREVMLSGRALSANANTLEKILYGKTIPRTQNTRASYGRLLDLDVIERAIRQAAWGNMVAVTDLGRESVLAIDGHTAGVLNKRLNRASAISFSVVANTGSGRKGYDYGRANERADFIRSQIERIPMFPERLADLSWSTWDNRAALESAWEVGTGAQAGDSSLATGWRVRDLFWIHPRRLSFNQNRDVVVLDESLGSSGDFRPVGFRLDDNPEKFVVSTPRLFNDYREREGLLMRVMYWSFFQRFGTRERLELMEVFGAPWRLVYGDGTGQAGNQDAIDASWEAIQDMNARSAGWLAPGVKAEFIQPVAGAGQVHKDVIEDARSVVTKFVLGGTATTDAVSTGLGSSVGDAHLSEEDLIIAADLKQRAGVIEHRLIDPIIELNYGPAELEYSPKFQFEIRGIIDREKSVRVVDSAAKAGIPVALEQAYDVIGLRQPRPDEPILLLVQPPADGGVPVAPRSQVVYPPGKAPAPGDLAIQPEEAIDPIPGAVPGALPTLPGQIPNPEQTDILELTPSDLASIVTVNEGRESVGKDPLKLPDGTPDPDGELTIAEFVQKKQSKAEASGKAEGTVEAERISPTPPPAPELPAAPPVAPISAPAKPGAPPAPPPEEPSFESPSGVAAHERDEDPIVATETDPTPKPKGRNRPKSR